MSYKERMCTSYNNEDEVGSAISDWLASNPAASRSDLFITTKVWPHLCGSDEDIEWSLADSLKKLRLDYVWGSRFIVLFGNIHIIAWRISWCRLLSCRPYLHLISRSRLSRDLGNVDLYRGLGKRCHVNEVVQIYRLAT